MPRNPHILFLWIIVLAIAAAATAQEGRPPHVVMTDPLPAAEQQKLFHLPEGFEIELVAAEPDIHKPLSINFDARGRLYISDTVEYPFPPKGPGRDSLKRLTDADGDGRYDKVETYVDRLSMPTGVTPVPGGVILFSVPAIRSCLDTDGDDRVDSRKDLYTEFGMVDTHGMNNGFTRWLDGWIYACHGFKNTSTVSGSDGQEITMNSGNGYRFRVDGSHIEYVWHGQVNPYGISFDSLGNLFTADCHSKPAYCLLRGAYYPSFAKLHDGLGFGPLLIEHTHGSTAISGVVHYSADQFPSQYRNTLFIGNCVTGRVNFDTIEVTGSSLRGVEQPDFITCDDPWFRPVELKLGPDGCLYVADFYNCIIGHYEVPLTHPRRDRERGRVWRVYYKGKPGEPAGKNPGRPRPVADLTQLDLQQLWQRLADGNLIVRTAATHEIVDRFGTSAIARLQEWIRAPSDPHQRAHGLWVLERMGSLDDELVRRLADDPKSLVRVHLVKALAGRPDWNATPLDVGDLVRAKLLDPDAFVRRAAVDALGRKPDTGNIDLLIRLWKETPPEDTYLIHTIRMAIRDHLLRPEIFAACPKIAGDTDSVNRLLDVMPGVRSAESADFVLSSLETGKARSANRNELIQYAARFCADDKMAALDRLVLAERGTTIDEQLSVFTSYRAGIQERGAKPSKLFVDWAAELAHSLLADSDEARVLIAVRVAGESQITELRDPVCKIALDSNRSPQLRTAAFHSLFALDKTKLLEVAAKVVKNSAEPVAVRSLAGVGLSIAGADQERRTLFNQLLIAEKRLAVELAAALTMTPDGGRMFLAAATEGKVSARLLQDLRVVGNLERTGIPDVVARVADLTKDLPDADEEIAKLIDERRAGFMAAKPDRAKGKAVFDKQCAICHQLAGEGTKVGPELDGIGHRGVDRVLEDVLDPNHIVDPSFRSTVVITDNGLTLTGLALREEGQILILVDANGEELRIPLNTIEERVISPLSPMPTVAIDVVSEEEFYHVMEYLLAQQQHVESPATSK